MWLLCQTHSWERPDRELGGTRETSGHLARCCHENEVAGPALLTPGMFLNLLSLSLSLCLLMGLLGSVLLGEGPSWELETAHLAIGRRVSEPGWRHGSTPLLMPAGAVRVPRLLVSALGALGSPTSRPASPNPCPRLCSTKCRLQPRPDAAPLGFLSLSPLKALTLPWACPARSCICPALPPLGGSLLSGSGVRQYVPEAGYP